MDQSKTDERRRQIVSVGFDRMVEIMRGDVVVTGLPEAAIITSAHYNFVKQSIDLIVEHESFDPVPCDNIIPTMMTVLTQRVERVVVVEDSADPAELLLTMKAHSKKGALVIVEWRDGVETLHG